MSKREYDETDVRIRPGRRGARPRTKTRPDHADAAVAMVTTVDRGRWTCAPDGDSTRPPVTAMRARELGRTPIVVGDRVGDHVTLLQGPAAGTLLIVSPVRLQDGDQVRVVGSN